jgi:thymidylate synthase (FAD)
VYWEDEYAALMKATVDVYNRMLKDNVAPEMARMLLPQSMLTEWYWTGNLLSFAHVYNERIAPNAQQEAQIFAMTLGAVIQSNFPTSWSALTKE